MSELSKKYEISSFEEKYCSFLRAIRGSGKCPEQIYKLSKRVHGEKNNLARYWLDKYQNVPFGKYTWGIENIMSQTLKSVGAFCSFANSLHIAPNGHRMDYVSTWNTLLEYKEPLHTQHTIDIGNDVWIGTNATIFDNVTIGDGAIIGAGALIKEDVPPYAVVVGRGKIIKYRFSQEIIDKLLIIKWWDWDDKKIFKSFELFHDPVAFVERYYKEK